MHLFHPQQVIPHFVITFGYLKGCVQYLRSAQYLRQRVSDSSFVCTVPFTNMQLNHTGKDYINLEYGATGNTKLDLFGVLKALSKTSAKPEFHSVV